MKERLTFQTVLKKRLDRKDHVWLFDQAAGFWKCVLCGAVTERPPDYPMPSDWLPERYTALTDMERAVCQGSGLLPRKY